MARVSPTLGQALTIVQPLLPLIDDRGHIEVRTRGSLAHFAIYRDALPRPRGYVECMFACFVTGCIAIVKRVVWAKSD